MYYISVEVQCDYLQFIVGSININKCPAQRYIPIYLIVGGVCGILQQCLSVLKRFVIAKKPENETANQEEESSKRSFNPLNFVLSLLTLFQFAWFIAGTINCIANKSV